MNNGVVLVRPGHVEVAGEGKVLATLGLGSCVAVALHDPNERVGALCHAILPDPLPGRPDTPSGRFASLAVPELVDALEKAGAERSRLRAWVVGGATMFPTFAAAAEAETIGARNVRVALAALEELGIRLVSEDVGGSHGRSVYLTIDDGTIEVRSVHRKKVVL